MAHAALLCVDAGAADLQPGARVRAAAFEGRAITSSPGGPAVSSPPLRERLSSLAAHGHRELIEPGQVGLVDRHGYAVRIDVRDAEVVRLFEDVSRDPELAVHGVVQRGTAASWDDVGHAVSDGP